MAKLYDRQLQAARLVILLKRIQLTLIFCTAVMAGCIGASEEAHAEMELIDYNWKNLSCSDRVPVDVEIANTGSVTAHDVKVTASTHGYESDGSSDAHGYGYPDIDRDAKYVGAMSPGESKVSTLTPKAPDNCGAEDYYRLIVSLEWDPTGNGDMAGSSTPPNGITI